MSKSVFSQEKLIKVFTHMSENGLSANKALKKEGYNWGSFSEWLQNCSSKGNKILSEEDHKWLTDSYARARKACIDYWMWGMHDTAHDESRDKLEVTEVIIDSQGRQTTKTRVTSDNSATQRDRLKVDTDKWIASKLFPKEYGEKIEQQITGKDGGPIEFIEAPRDETYEEWLIRQASNKGGLGTPTGATNGSHKG